MPEDIDPDEANRLYEAVTSDEVDRLYKGITATLHYQVPMPAFRYIVNLVVDFARRKEGSFPPKDAVDAFVSFMDHSWVHRSEPRIPFDLTDRFYQEARPYDEAGGLDLRRGPCILSKDFQWSFDLHDPTIGEAVAWLVERTHERFLSRFIAIRGAIQLFDGTFLVQFPGTNWEAMLSGQKTAIYGGTFGSVRKHCDRSMLLSRCRKASKRSTEKGLFRLKRWAPFIVRCRWLSDPKFQFPPISHVVGTMVRHHDFNEEVALELYGAFPDCNLWVRQKYLPERDPRSELDDPPFDRTVIGISGLTVLFLACTIIFDDAACAKLLQMPTAGLRILKDLYDNRLGDFCSYMLRPQVEIMLQSVFEAQRNLTMTAWGQRLSLLVSLHICRPEGKLARWQVGDHIELLVMDALRLGPSRLTSVPINYEAAAIGFFAGIAIGTLRQHLSQRVLDKEAKGRKLKTLVVVGAEMTTNFISIVQSIVPLLGGGSSATPFSLLQTQAALCEKIDRETAQRINGFLSARLNVLQLFDERLRKFCRIFGADVDLEPLLMQIAQAYQIASYADPETHFDQMAEQPQTRYTFLVECPSKHLNGLYGQFWSNLFEKDLPLVDKGAISGPRGIA